MSSCPLCSLTSGRRATIESEYIRGVISADDVVIDLKEEGIDIDILSVMIHFDDHDAELEGEAQKKRNFLKKPQYLPEPQPEEKFSDENEGPYVGPYEPEELPEVKEEDDTHLSELASMLLLLKEKLYVASQGKEVRSIGVLTKEVRETLREIERVKKATRASLADRTSELFSEHEELNRFLMFNLCVDCSKKHMQFLKGEFTTFAVDAHGRQDGVLDGTDAVDSGTVE